MYQFGKIYFIHNVIFYKTNSFLLLFSRIKELGLDQIPCDKNISTAFNPIAIIG